MNSEILHSTSPLIQCTTVVHNVIYYQIRSHPHFLFWFVTPFHLLTASAFAFGIPTNWLTWTLAPKSKKHKKRKGGAKGKPNGDSDQLNGVKNDEGIENNEPEEQEQEPETPTESSKSPIEDEAPPTSPGTRHEHPYTNGTSMVTNDVNTVASGLPDVEAAHSLFDQPDVTSTSLENLSIDKPSNENAQVPSIESPKARLDALASERTALRDEVAWLRRSLEQMQGKHEEELANVREHLEETQGEKEHAESQYRNLLGKVNTIKSTLGERLKADAVC